MASKKKPAETNENETVIIPPRKTRQTAVIQPDLAVEIEQCKKRICSLKSLNKLTPVIEGMDKDALTALKKLVDLKLEAA